MNNELTMQNNTQQDVKRVSKSETIRFVHDVKELEVKARTLEDMAKECYAEAGQIEKKASNELMNSERNLDSAKYKAEYLPKDEEKKLKSDNLHAMGVAVGVSFLILFFGGSCLAAVAYHTLPESMAAISVITYLSISFIIPFVIICAVNSNRSNRAKAQIEKNKYELEAAVKTAEDNVDRAIAMQSRVQEQAKALCSHAQELDRTATKIRNQLTSIYSINIVTPKYRNLQCLSLIDEVFENDQADTMREATLLCETRLYQGGVLQKMEELAESIHCIHNVIESMARDVSMMSQDVFSIAENSAAALSEAKSTRYAAEATAQAAERVAFYEQIRYAENR